jgi:hypothetical protein
VTIFFGGRRHTSRGLKPGSSQVEIPPRFPLQQFRSLSGTEPVGQYALRNLFKAFGRKSAAGFIESHTKVGMPKGKSAGVRFVRFHL